LESIEIFEEMGEINHRSYALTVLAGAYESKGEYKKAYENFKEYKALQDSVFNIEKAKEIANLTAQRENIENEKEISELKSQNQINELEIQRTYNLLIFLLILLILVIVVVFLIYKQNRIKNKLINSLYESEKQLNAAVSAKDNLFSIIGHDLKNPIGAMMLSNSLLIDRFDYIDNSMKRDLIEKNQKTVKHLLKLLEDLLTWARSQQGNIDFNPEKIEFDIMLDDIKSLLSESADKKNIEIKVETEEDIFAKADKMMLNTILRNLVSNSIKYTRNDGEIKIKAAKTDNKQILLSVEDNGLGMDESTRAKLFKGSKIVSSPGTNNEKGTGLGLMLCQEFVEKHDGKIWVESEKEKGSTFYFTIPGFYEGGKVN
jgi:signal transduction histidine kinase